MDHNNSQDRLRAEAAFAEFLRRRGEGEDVDFEAFVEEHPGLAAALRLLESIHREPGDLSGTEGLAEDLRATLGAAEPRLGAGRILGDYRILGELGRGGMGIVYEAEQVSLGRRVALKVLPLQAILDPTQRERFRREAEAAARLHHPNIVPVYGVGEAGGIHYYAMQHIQGRGLDRVIAELRELPTPTADLGSRIGEEADPAAPPDCAFPPPAPPRGRSSGSRQAFYYSVARVGIQVANALAYAHGEGILHRDIKPSNLILDTQGSLWVTDFGLAKLEGADDLTQPGDLMGTLRYIPPEQLSGSCDARSDVYSLGVTLYELLTFQPAFDGKDRARLIEQLTKTEPPRPRSLERRIPADLETIILKAIHKEPGRRYQNAAALAEDLRRFLAGEPILGRRSGTFERTAKWVKRRPALAALVAVSCVAAMSLLVGSAWFTFKLKVERDRVTTEHEDGRSTLYAAHIHLAQAAWGDARVGRVLELLEGEGCTPGRADQKDLRGWEWYYLRGLCHRELLALRKGGPRYSSVAWSPDDRWVAASNLDNPGVELWDLTGGKPPRILSGHAYFVNSVAFSPDSAWLISGAEDGFTKLWDVETGQQLRSFAAGWWVRCVAMSPDRRLLAAGKQLVVWVWDLVTGRVATLAGHQDTVMSVAFSPDGRRLASSSRDGTAKVWETASWKEVHTLRVNDSEAWTVAFSPDSKTIATGSEDPTVKLWDAATGELRRTLRGHGAATITVAFSPDGRWLASASKDQTIRLWDVSSGAPGLTLHASGRIAFSPDGRFLVSAAADGTVKFWDTAIDSQEARNLWKEYIAVDLDFSPDGRWLAMASRDGTARVFDVASGEERETLRLRAEAWAVAFSPDSRRLATGSDDATARIWSIEDGTRLRKLEGHKGSVRGLAFSPDGALLATGAIGDNTVRLWDPESGKVKLLLKGHTAGVGALEFSPDGRCLASASGDKTVKLWNPADGREIHTLRGHTEGLSKLAFSRDGRRLASAGGDKSIKLWDVESGEELRTFRGHTASVLGVAFSPDGRRLASGSLDASLKIWDTSSGQETLSLREFSGAKDLAFVYNVAFSPDGRWLASCEAGLKLREAPPEAEARDRNTFNGLRAPEAMRAWHWGEAQASESAARWFAAAFHLSRLLDLGQPQAELYLRRGLAHAELGEWQAAAADLRAGLELGAPREAAAALEAAVAARDWMLGRLREAGGVCIRCGGGEHRSPDGKLWAPDRFFTSGQPYADGAQITGTGDPLLYQTGRLFPPGESRASGYRLPVPDGRYSVSLHFAETGVKSAGERFFDVLLEGERVARALEPLAEGFATASVKTFETQVRDGYLDLELVPRAGVPAMSALEVRKLNDLLPPASSAKRTLPEVSDTRSNYQDDFPAADGPPRGWTAYSGGWATESGALCLKDPLPCEGWILAGDPPIFFSGVQSIEFDLEFLNRPESGTGRHGGVCFFSQDLGGWFTGNAYALEWSDSYHGYRLSLCRRGAVTISFHKGDEPDPGRRWRIEIQGETIRVLVDGRLKGEVKDSTYRSGYLGFWTYCFGVRIRVDNVKVQGCSQEFASPQSAKRSG